MQGHPRLVKVLAKIYSRELQQTLDPMKNVVTTIGAYEAMYAAFQAVVNPGDEVCYILYCWKYMWVLFIKLARPVLQPLNVLPLMESVLRAGDFNNVNSICHWRCRRRNDNFKKPSKCRLKSWSKILHSYGDLTVAGGRWGGVLRNFTPLLDFYGPWAERVLYRAIRTRTCCDTGPHPKDRSI